MTPKFRLENSEKNSPLWLKLVAHFEDRLALMREQNDTQRTETETAFLRGRIAMLKELLSLQKELDVPAAYNDGTQ